MGRNRWKAVKCLLLILIPMVLVLGCTAKNDEDELVEEDIEEDITLDVSAQDREILIRSENISDMVVNLYGIDNASSIIFNDMVAIALEMAEGNTLTEDVRMMIRDTVMENDQAIKEVLITDNKKIFDQLEEIVLSLLSGEKSYDDHVVDISRIIEKLK